MPATRGNGMNKIWISKYALSTGISCHDWDGKISEHGYVSPQGLWTSQKLGTGAYLTQGEAIAAAEKMRSAKIAALTKSIEKMKALRFTSDGSIS